MSKFGGFLKSFLKGVVLGCAIYDLAHSLLVRNEPTDSLVWFIIGIFNMGVFFLLKEASE